MRSSVVCSEAIRTSAGIARGSRRAPSARSADSRIDAIGVVQPLEHRQRREPGCFGGVGVLPGHALDHERGREAHLAAVVVERTHNDRERREGVVAPQRRQRAHPNRSVPVADRLLDRSPRHRCQGGRVRQDVEAQCAVGGRPLGRDQPVDGRRERGRIPGTRQQAPDVGAHLGLGIGEQRQEVGPGCSDAVTRDQPLHARGALRLGERRQRAPVDLQRPGPVEVSGDETDEGRSSSPRSSAQYSGADANWIDYTPGMTREIIVSILEGEGAEGKGGAFKIPEAREATCFISNPGELLAIARVVKVELKDQYLTLATAKDERFVFAYGDVLGFKLAVADAVKGSLRRLRPLGGRRRKATVSAANHRHWPTTCRPIGGLSGSWIGGGFAAETDSPADPESALVAFRSVGGPVEG